MSIITITVPENAPRHGGETLTVRTDRPAWIVRDRTEGCLRCSIPITGADGPGRVHVPLREGIDVAVAAGMAIEVIPEPDDRTGHPIPVRPATGAP
jgi:hypothetical protein